MEKSSRLLKVEFVIFYLLTPILLALPFPVILKIGTIITVLSFLLFQTFKDRQLSWKLFLPNHAKVPRKMLWLFGAFMIISTGVVYSFFPDSLFKVLVQQPYLWVVILLVYTFLSVLPQEWLYRYLYKERYGAFLPEGILGMVLNGLIFSLAHVMFLNVWILILTFIGGCLFYSTYRRTNSLFLVSVEHALYGLWIFTLGVGEYLAFPG